jgi:hypothetical protein
VPADADGEGREPKGDDEAEANKEIGVSWREEVAAGATDLGGDDSSDATWARRRCACSWLLLVGEPGRVLAVLPLAD